MNVCRGLRGYCLRREWARNAFAFLGVALFLVTVWVAIDFQVTILEWLHQNFLLHGALFGGLCVVNVGLMSSFLCLGFSDCSTHDHDHHGKSYESRGRSRPVFPGALTWVDRLGSKR